MTLCLPLSDEWTTDCTAIHQEVERPVAETRTMMIYHKRYKHKNCHSSDHTI